MHSPFCIPRYAIYLLDNTGNTCHVLIHYERYLASQFIESNYALFRFGYCGKIDSQRIFVAERNIHGNIDLSSLGTGS